tara:strand:- start:168 stop:644 length:477 start_codon:yes stop_codon:yes gene_type:complete
MIDLNEELDDTEGGDEIFEFEENKEDFSKAYLEDARETMIIDIDKENSIIQGHLLAIQARIPELERIVSTILKEYGGEWSNSEKELLIRLVKRRGWPIEENKVKERLLMVATDMAENKGGSINITRDSKKELKYEVKPIIERIKIKMKESEKFIKSRE